MTAETFDTVFNELSGTGDLVVIVGDDRQIANTQVVPESGIYAGAAAAYLMTEAPKCDLQIKTVCGQATLCPNETVRSLFKIPTRKEENIFECTLVMGIGEDVELKTANLLITYGNTTISFNIISENNGDFRARHLGQIIYEEGVAMSYKRSDSEEDDIWKNYFASLEVLTAVSSWEKPKACDNCHFNKVSSADFV